VTRRGRIRSLLRWAGLSLVGILVVIQFFPAERTNPPVVAEIVAPEEVMTILDRACYDCHSNRTRWPWYSRVAPLSWWLVEHVDDGRGDLNFTEWPMLDFETQELAFHDIEEQIAEGEMPLFSYLLLHPGARLSEAEKRTLIDWAAANR